MATVNGHDAAEDPATSASEVAAVTRRGLILGSAALVLTACVRGGGRPVVGQGEGLWYVIQVGDTVSGLSRRSGVTADLIIEVNHLGRDGLRPGARIWLPGAQLIGPDQVTDRKNGSTRQTISPRAQSESVGHYEVVPRSAWTNEAVGDNNRPMGKVLKITVHHTDEHAGMADLSDLEVVRRIEHYHRGPEKRWAAIGYHYLVGKDGRVYEGRPVKFQGAHVSSNNENNLGISVIGDFNQHLPNTKQLIALTAFLDDQRRLYDVPRERVFGHREVKSTTVCPGAMLMAWVKAYRNNK